MKKKRLNKVLNIVVTLMVAIALMLGNVTSVAAYTADTPLTGYPYAFDSLKLGGWNSSVGSVFSDFAISADQYSYYLDISNCSAEILTIGNNDISFVFPYDPELYNYYFVGSLMAASGSSFDVTNFQSNYYNSPSTSGYDNFDFEIYPLSSRDGNGISFSVDLSSMSGDNVNLSCFFIGGRFNLSGRLWFSGSIIPVPKSGSEADTLSSILAALTQINQNIITSNTLQQQTIDAINQNTTNTSNWFTALISNLSTWYYQRKEDLSNWFLDIDNRLSSGFAALYSQMTKEQDEKLNGYDDTTQSDAADNFNTESDKLTELEGQLNDQSHGFVSDFTDTGFDVGVLSTVSESLIFVTTWFTNFWNLGGIFTACLNLCFALSIVFYVLRFRK